MSSSALTSIALFAPVIASNVVFSARRASRGVDSMDESPLYGVANMNIAGAQVLKGARAVKALSIATDPLLQRVDKGAEYSIRNMSKQVNLAKSIPGFKSIANVVDFTSRNINPVIVGTSALKVASSDDKVDTWARESTSLLTMFGAEEATKKLIGMPIFSSNKGKNFGVSREAYGKNWVKKVLSEKQYDNVKQYINNNRGAKLALSSGKGLAFAGASIAGYKLGCKISDSILGKKEND